MDKLLRVLFELLENPLVLVVVIGWIAGIVGKVVQHKQKTETARRRAVGRGAEPEPAQRGRTAEEVAAEMRRILGMEGPAPAAAPAKARVEPPKAVAVQRREALEGDRGPQPLRTSRLGNVGVHVDPHVGESVQRRAAPVSGQVAGHALGTLGGRSPAMQQTGPVRRRLLGLEDLSRAIVLREVLDAPRAMRGWDR